MEQRKIKNILWDWNGTLLDDMDLCIECMNTLLKNRSLPELSQEYYREVFTFPVKDYFINIGFDFSNEPFEVPADEFVLLYNRKFHQAALYNNARKSLGNFKKKGYRQFILSAQEQKLLHRLLDHYNIREYFEAATGTTDNYAHSKVEAGLIMMEQLALNPRETIMIGDTIHDYEVATALGVSCLLISHGHQSPTRLRSTGATVLEDYPEISGHLTNHHSDN